MAPLPDTLSHREGTSAGQERGQSRSMYVNDEASSNFQDKSPLKMRELAKGALLSLAPHGIRYPQIVNEGIDPYLLHQLYEEVGIKDGHTEHPVYRVDHQDYLRNSTRIGRVGPESNIQTNKASSQIQDIPFGPDIQMTSQPEKPLIVQNSLPISDQFSTRLQSNINQQSASAVRSLVEQKYSPASTTAPSIAMERKDRIAQLLAAKTGKPVPTRNTTDQSKPTPLSHLTPASSGPNDVASSRVEAQSIPPAQQAPKSGKSKAQTELVRQKMESLKKEAIARAQARDESQAQDNNLPLPIPPPARTASTAREPLQPNFGGNDRSIGTNSVKYSPSSTSQVVSSGPGQKAGFGSLIPGLFMTSAEPINVHSEVMVPESRRESQEVMSPQAADYDLSEQVSASSHAQDQFSDAQGTRTRFNLAALSQDGSRTRMSQKRPLAADSFDEPASPHKRPFGRKDSDDQVEITISDDSDDDSEDVGMDIEEDSQASGRLNQEQMAANHPGHQAAQSLQALALPLPARPVVTSTTSHGAVTTTPGKEKDAEDLWRVKNMEIEIMRKRIAEMEKRQKAKRDQSQTQSPQMSISSTPPNSRTPVDLRRENLPSPPAAAHVGFADTIGQSLDQGPSPKALGITAVPQQPPSSPSTIKTPSKDEVLRVKIARRQLLQDGLPDLDAEVQKTQEKLAQAQARLAEVKREAEKREAEIQQARKREAELMEEAVKLEEQLHKGLSGRDRYSKELQTLSVDLQNSSEDEEMDSGPHNSQAAHQNSASAIAAHPYNENGLRATTRPTSHSPPFAVITPSSDTALPPTEVSGTSSALANGPDLGGNYKEASVMRDLGHRSSPEEPLASNGSSSSNPSSVDRVRSPMSIAIESNSRSQLSTGFSSGHSSFAGAYAEGGAPSDLAARTEVSLGASDNDDDIEGSVSMSDSDSDHFGPADQAEADLGASDLGDEDYEPDDGLAPNVEFDRDVSNIDEDYEPAEPDQSVDVDQASPSPDSAEQSHPSPTVDDIEDGLQLSEANILTKPQEFLQSVDDNLVHGNVCLFLMVVVLLTLAGPSRE